MSTHPAITATKPANQGEQDQSSSHAIYPSAGEQDRVTSDHQTWGNAAQTHVNQRLEEGVSSVSSRPPRSRWRKPSLERTSEEKDLLTQHLEERCQKGNEVSRKKGESKRVNTEWGGGCIHGKHVVWKYCIMEQRALQTCWHKKQK